MIHHGSDSIPSLADRVGRIVVEIRPIGATMLGERPEHAAGGDESGRFFDRAGLTEADQFNFVTRKSAHISIARSRLVSSSPSKNLNNTSRWLARSNRSEFVKPEIE